VANPPSAAPWRRCARWVFYPI